MLQSTKTIFKQTSIYGASNTFRKLSGVIILPIMKVYTTQEEFGVWMLFETIFLFIQVLSGWGVKSGFTRWYYEMDSEKDKKSLFFTATLTNYVVSLVVVFGLGWVLYYFSMPILKYPVSDRLILLFSLSGLFRLFQDVPFILLRLQQKAVQQAVYSSVSVLFLILFTVYFLQYEKAGFEGVYWAQLLANGITFLILIPILFKNSRWHFKGKELRDMIHYGLPLALSGILTTVLNLSDRHIINQFYNPAESGNYGLAFKVANLLEMVFVASFMTSYTYYYYKSLNDPESLKLFNKLQRYFLILMTIAGLGIILFSREIIWVVSAGDDYYQEGQVLIPFLILGLIFSGSRQFFTLPLNKHKKTGIISTILIVAGCLNIGLNFILVPRFGKQGAAWATLVVQLFSMIWFYVVSNKYESFQINFKETILLLLIWSIFVAVVFVIPDNFWQGLLIKGMLFATFIGLLVLLKIIRREEIGEIRNTIKLLLGKKQ